MMMAALTVLAGCADLSGIAPDAKMANAGALAPGKAVLSARRIDWPADAWWKSYRDPQLDSLVSRALSGNPVLKTARERIALAKSMASYRHSAQLPQANMDAYSSRERFTALQFIPPPWGGHTEWNNGAMASFSYDLDLWGRLASAWKASLNEVRAKSAEEQEVRIELESAVVRNYARLAMAYQLHDIAAAQYAELELGASIEKKRYEAGMGTEMALSEAQSPLPLAQARIESVDEQIAFLKSELAALAGEGPGAGERIARPSLSLDMPDGLPDRLPANLVGRRPDVRALRWEVEAAGDRVDSARAAFYPNIDLSAGAGFLALGFGQLVSRAALMAGAGPALSLPLFDGGRRRALASASTSAYDIAVDRYNETVVRALKDVSDQLVSYRTESGRLTKAQKSLHLAQQACMLSNEAYHAGLTDYRRVLECQATVLGRKADLARISAAKLESYARLMLALGGGAR
jgi:NodT family efflux transporter outer membrane factor (OMF) lipoprotein